MTATEKIERTNGKIANVGNSGVMGVGELVGVGLLAAMVKTTVWLS